MILSSYAFRKVYVKGELFLQLLDAVQRGYYLCLGTWNLKLIFVIHITLHLEMVIIQ